jgi:hypothetical protein
MWWLLTLLDLFAFYSQFLLQKGRGDGWMLWQVWRCFIMSSPYMTVQSSKKVNGQIWFLCPRSWNVWGGIMSWPITLVSINNNRTNACVDWSNFSVAYWGWLENGSFRWSAPLLIQDGLYGGHLGVWFPSITGQMPRSVDPIFMWHFH